MNGAASAFIPIRVQNDTILPFVLMFRSMNRSIPNDIFTFKIDVS